MTSHSSRFSQVYSRRELDMIGIGIGPANLSLAALARNISGLEVEFFDKKPEFSWHEGLAFDESMMQSSFLEDLVTPVSPTNRLSFVSFLFETGKLLQFLSSYQARISRLEFSAYMKWVTKQLGCLRFGVEVQDISYVGDGFEVASPKGVKRARTITLGFGTQPRIPNWASVHLSPSCRLAHTLLDGDFNVQGKDIAIIGGGQTSAEIMLVLLSGRFGKAQSLQWITRRSNFLGMDENPFANEFFTPAYVRHFYKMSNSNKIKVIQQQKLFSDGITAATLDTLHKAIYQQSYKNGVHEIISLTPGQEVVGLSRDGDGYQIETKEVTENAVNRICVDKVILCTGYNAVLPPFLDRLKSRMNIDRQGNFAIGPDYQIEWDGPSKNAIYAQNLSRNSHGIADAQICLIAWRSAIIINQILGCNHFNTKPPKGLRVRLRIPHWCASRRSRRLPIATWIMACETSRRAS